MRRNKAVLAIQVALAAAVLLMAAACGDTESAPDTGTGSPGSSGSSGTGSGAAVSGTVTYREPVELAPGAKLIVELRDTSLQDVASVLIARQVVDLAPSADLSQAPAAFEVAYNPGDIDAGAVYSVEARIEAPDGGLAFINDTAYDVITRGYPDTVDMVLVMVQPPPEG